MEIQPREQRLFRPCGPHTSLETLNIRHLDFCDLFYNAVSNQAVNGASNGWVYDELERTGKEAVVIRLGDCPCICLDKRKKAAKSLIQNEMCLG